MPVSSPERGSPAASSWRRSGRFAKVHTEIAPAGEFTVAEDYHQDYYRKNPIRYRYYRASCGRDARVAEVWQDSK